MDLFQDILPSLNLKTGNLLEVQPDGEDDYVPFVVNKAFSMAPETIFYSQFMNLNHQIDKKMQYDYYYCAVPYRKYFKRKWVKAEPLAEIAAVKSYFSCSTKKAKEYLKILTKEDIESILKVVQE